MNLNLDKSTWKRVMLGDIAAASKEKVDPDSGEIERYIAGEHMDTDDLKIQRWGEVGDGYLGPAFHRRFHPGQVLYGSRRTYLRKVAVAEFDGVTANTTFVVETKDSSILRQEFLPFVMSSEPFHAFAVQESKGSVNPYVNWSDIARYEFDLPPLAEQQRLVDLLWAAENAANARCQLKARADATIRQLTTNLLSRFDWTLSLGQVLSGIIAGRSLPGSSVPAEEGKFGVLKVSAVGGKGFVATENKELLDQSAFRPEYKVNAGDLLITRANTSAYVGRPCLVPANYPNLMLSDKTLRLEVNEGLVLPKFVFEYLQAPRIREAIAAVATGTGAAMKNISQAEVRSLAFPDASLVEQAEFVDKTAKVRVAADSVERELRTVRALKVHLLAEVFV